MAKVQLFELSEFSELTESYTDKFNNQPNNIYIKNFDLIYDLTAGLFNRTVITLRITQPRYMHITFNSTDKPYNWIDVKQ